MTYREFLESHNLIAVQCNTRKQAEEFCKIMEMYGRTWASGLNYLCDRGYYWFPYKKFTCYDNKGFCSFYDWYASRKIKVISFEELRIEEGN